MEFVAEVEAHRADGREVAQAGADAVFEVAEADAVFAKVLPASTKSCAPIGPAIGKRYSALKMKSERPPSGAVVWLPFESRMSISVGRQPSSIDCCVGQAVPRRSSG